jgi:putative nucleotidyltransferase with HDIG domain
MDPLTATATSAPVGRSHGRIHAWIEQLVSNKAAQTAYVSAIVTGGAIVIGIAARDLAGAPISMAWLILAALSALSGMATIRLPNAPASFSISDSFTITAALLFGPAAGAIAVAIDSLAISLQLARRNFKLQRLLFNAVAPALAMWVSARCFFAMTGSGPLIDPTTPLGRLFVPLVLFTALYFVLNTGLIAIAIGLDQRTSPVTIWRRHFLPLWLAHFGGAGVATLLISLIHSRGADLVVLALVAPIPLILYATFKNVVGRVEDQLGHLEHVNRMHLATIETLAHAIDAKDAITHGHIRRVQERAMLLAHALELEDEPTLRALEAASLLHDMGKLAVPEHILNKPGKLTGPEFDQMKQHATIGADILSSIDFPYPVVPIVRHHHENWDGTGYPDRLKGTAIPIGARILSVVDCYDALTSDRPYRPKMTPEEAIAIVQERSGTMYDPRVVAQFVESHPTAAPAAEARVAATVFSAIIDNAQSDAARRRTEVAAPVERALMAAMCDLGTAMAARSETLAEDVHRALGQIMPATCTVIYVYDPVSDELVARYVSGRYEAELAGLAIPFGQRLTGWVAAQRATIVNSDAALDLGSVAMELSPVPRSCLSTALFIDDEIVGVLTVYSMSIEPFTDHHAAFVEVLAPRIARALRSRPIESSGPLRLVPAHPLRALNSARASGQ